MGNNQMLAADIQTGEIRRFLTGPSGCEITGVVTAPDGRSMVVNIQHPGETSIERSDPGNPKAVSSWPDGAAGGRPRSSTIAIRKTTAVLSARKY
jgi:secreted PhoX family phosphatase